MNELHPANTMIDTHIHLDFRDFSENLDSVVREARLCGVQRFIIPGASLKTLDTAAHIAMTHSDVYFATGLHPCDIDDVDLEDLDSKIPDSKDFRDSRVPLDSINHVKNGILFHFSPFLDSKKCKAVGECGLDYFRLPESYSKKVECVQKQKLCFEAQINIALEHDLPLILHVRDEKNSDDASIDVATILQKYYHFNNLRGVFHCFNANERLLQFSDRFYYGIGGIVTFKNALELVNILPRIPLERILLETDAPYLSPIPHRGKRNESKFLPHIAQKIAEILNIQVSEVCKVTTKNARELFLV